MKIGMNSQTLRIVYDNGDISDYNITDGTTSSKVMKIISAGTIGNVVLDGYTVMKISSETDPMSWGSSVDKLTDITYTDVSVANSDSHQYKSYANIRRSPMGTTFYTPITAPVRMTPPPPRYDFSKDDRNEKNFKKLFGK